MKLQTLLASFSLSSDMQYFDLVLKRITSQQKALGFTMFLNLPKNDRKNFIKYVVTALESNPLTQQDFNNFIDLL